MSANMDMLRERMNELNINNEDMAKKIGIDASTFYRKIKTGGINFTVGQVHSIVEVLNLTKEEALSIFL